MPSDFESIAELSSNKEAVSNLVESYEDYEIESNADNLFNQIQHIDFSNSIENGITFYYGYEKDLFIGKSKPVALDKRSDGTLNLTRLTSINARPDVHAFNAKVDQTFNWKVSDSNMLELSSLSSGLADSVVYISQAYVEDCGGTSFVYLTLRKVEFKLVYNGERLDQYLVRYSGDNIAGTSYNAPCFGLNDREWSKVELVNVRKNSMHLSEKLTTGQIAVSVGIETDGPNLHSPSLINLNSDASAYIQRYDLDGTWQFTEAGALELMLSDGSSLVYDSIGQEGLAEKIVGQKTTVDGKRFIISGLLMQVDESFLMETLIGNYETISELNEPSGLAYSFQDNFLGQESIRDSEGNWVKRGSGNFDLYYYNWTADDDNNGVNSEYLVKVDELGNYINYSKLGCAENDETCYVWRSRSFRFLGREGDIYYVMQNSKVDYTFQGYQDNILTWGSIGLYRKTDFVAPPVE